MRTKVPTLLAIYRSRWNGYRWSNYVWLEVFGNGKKKLPMNNETLNKVICDDSGRLYVNLVLYKHNAKGIRRHRVFVRCDRCLKMVPAGRIHQHTC
jgi:hypothetical protein